MSSNRRAFIKQMGLGAIGLGLINPLPQHLYAEKAAKILLPRSTPEKQGISSSAIQAFLDGVEKSKTEFHSIMILRHGYVVAEGWWAPYAAPYKHTMYSLSKSFTSSAVGLANHAGLFRLDSPVSSFFPNELPGEISANLAIMTVKDLLTMSTGHAKDTFSTMRNAKGESWSKAFLSLPVDHKPGTHFLYNSGATYMLSAIVQKVTGQTVFEYLKPRLFEPLGIEGMDWETDPAGITMGASGLRIKTEDIAKFGQLYLQKGKWNGQQIIPASWVEEASTSHIDSSPSVVKRPKEEDDWAQGYGYQFWRCRHNAYRADGAFGQFSFILPDLDAVVVITEESFGAQTTMDLVWSHLLPAMKQDPLPEDRQAQSALQQRLKSLSLEAPKMNQGSPTSARISGKKFILEKNAFNASTIDFTFSNDFCVFSLEDEKGVHQVKCGLNKWIEEKNFKTQVLFPMTGRPVVSTPLAASVTWQDENTLLVTLRYAETAHSDNITCAFTGDQVTITFLNSVAKGNPTNVEQRQPIQGKIIT